MEGMTFKITFQDHTVETESEELLQIIYFI